MNYVLNSLAFVARGVRLWYAWKDFSPQLEKLKKWDTLTKTERVACILSGVSLISQGINLSSKGFRWVNAGSEELNTNAKLVELTTAFVSGSADVGKVVCKEYLAKGGSFEQWSFSSIVVTLITRMTDISGECGAYGLINTEASKRFEQLGEILSTFQVYTERKEDEKVDWKKIGNVVKRLDSDKDKDMAQIVKVIFKFGGEKLHILEKEDKNTRTQKLTFLKKVQNELSDALQQTPHKSFSLLSAELQNRISQREFLKILKCQTNEEIIMNIVNPVEGDLVYDIVYERNNLVKVSKDTLPKGWPEKLKFVSSNIGKDGLKIQHVITSELNHILKDIDDEINIMKDRMK